MPREVVIEVSYESENSGLDMLESVARVWWLGLVVGLITLAGGVLLVAYPGPTLTVVALLVGIELLIGGIFLIVGAFGRPAGSRAWGVLGGAIALIAGVIVIRHPSESLLVVAMAVGIYLILAGTLRLVGAFEVSEGRGWLVFAGFVDLVLGIVVVSWPQFGITTLAIVLGIVLIVRGLALVALSFVVRGLGRELRSAGEPPAAPAV
jgi:uncharacterized membrane protein HdeD (DUF308 family)